MQGRSKHNTRFLDADISNTTSYMYYINVAENLCLSRYVYEDVPDTCDMRYLEVILMRRGNAVFFMDEVINEHMVLPVNLNGNFDVRGNPTTYTAYSEFNSYQHQLTQKDSVLIFNNMTKEPSYPYIQMFAKRMWDFDRIIDVNVRAQKTPVLIRTNKRKLFSLKQVYKDYDGDVPVIYASENFDTKDLDSLKTDAPYVADKIYELKTKYWNELLTYLGIPNVTMEKKERMLVDEVERQMGGATYSRYSPLEMREKAVEQINDMFGLNIKVSYRESIDVSYLNDSNKAEGGDLE